MNKTNDVSMEIINGIISEDNSDDNLGVLSTDGISEKAYDSISTVNSDNNLDVVNAEDNSVILADFDDGSDSGYIDKTSVTDGTNIKDFVNDLHDIVSITKQCLGGSDEQYQKIDIALDKLANSDIDMVDIDTGSINIYGRYGHGNVSVQVQYSVPAHSMTVKVDDFDALWHQYVYNNSKTFDFSVENIENMHSFANEEQFSQVVDYFKGELYDFKLWDVSAKFDGENDHLGFNVGTTGDYVNHNEAYFNSSYGVDHMHIA